MKNKRFFKLIVVNYNNYIYIKKCFDSIKNQTFKDFICIIVDDVSSDKSPNIAKIYEKRYPE
jgi:glycosyltransferase involved in cell wall biosynthesis